MTTFKTDSFMPKHMTRQTLDIGFEPRILGITDEYGNYSYQTNKLLELGFILGITVEPDNYPY